MTREEARTALSDRNNLWWGMSKEEKKYYSEALDMAISALAENKGEWIPVSERLPEIGQRVIVTVDTFDDGLVVSETVYTKHGFLCGNGIAWQPLPEPYEI